MSETRSQRISSPQAPYASLSPRARLVAALALAFGMACVQDVKALPLLAAVALAALLASGEPMRLVRRMRGAMSLAAGFVLILPLAAGQDVLAQIGPFSLRAEGLEAGALIGGRLLAIVSVTLSLLACVPPFQLVAGLRGLGAPALMADIALLTLRYLDEARAELARAQLARRLRGGAAGWRALPDHALILATCLIRAHRRSERLWAAMRLRGYEAAVSAPTAAFNARDWIVMTIAVATALGLFWWGRTS